jgi:hypothetical protein
VFLYRPYLPSQGHALHDQGIAEDDCRLAFDSTERNSTTNLIKKPLGIMRPCNRREFNEAYFLREPLVVMVWTNTIDFGQWIIRSTNINSAKITPLFDFVQAINKSDTDMRRAEGITYRKRNTIGVVFA